MRESSIESYLVRKVKEHGGLCYKCRPRQSWCAGPHHHPPHWQDGVCGARKPRVGEAWTKVQESGREASVEKRGADVRVLYGMDAVKEFLREVFGDAVHTA